MTSYFELMKVSPQNIQNLSKNMTQTNRFLAEIIKINSKKFQMFFTLRFSKNANLLQINSKILDLNIFPCLL